MFNSDIFYTFYCSRNAKIHLCRVTTIENNHCESGITIFSWKVTLKMFTVPLRSMNIEILLYYSGTSSREVAYNMKMNNPVGPKTCQVNNINY